MTPSNRKTILQLVQISDIGPLFSCLGIGYGLTSHRHLLDLLNSLETRHPIQVFIATIFLAFGWHVTLRSNDFYRSRRVEGYLKETRDVCSASVICALFSFLWPWLIASPPHAQFRRAWVRQHTLLRVDRDRSHACSSHWPSHDACAPLPRAQPQTHSDRWNQ